MRVVMMRGIHSLMLLLALPLVSASLFEGDIVLDEETLREMRGGSGYDATRSQLRHWPNAVVPYTFDESLDARTKEAIKRGFEEYAKHTCIRFVPRAAQSAYVKFAAKRGCYSNVGRTRREQVISIGRGCTRLGTVVHEMMHALGFYHEQSRQDRDDYVTIYWDRIKKGRENNFKKYSHGNIDSFGEPYDFNSVMHYGRTAFGNGQVTIEAKRDPSMTMGQRKGFSRIDIRQLNIKYCGGPDYKPNPNPDTKKPDATQKPPKPGCVDYSAHCGFANAHNCKRQSYALKCPKSCKMC